MGIAESENPIIDATAWKLIFGFVVGVAIIGLIGPPLSLEIRPLDARFFYTGAEASAYLEQIGPAGRSAYLRAETVDFGLILIYTTLIARLFVRRFGRQALCAIAFVPGLFDLIETAGAFSVVWQGKSEAPAFLGYATALKWITTFLVLGILALSRFRKVRYGTR